MTTRDHLRTVHPSATPDISYPELLGADRLAPLRLPPEERLAQLARSSTLLHRTRALAVWIGRERRLAHDTASLSEDDIRAAADHLSTTDSGATDVPPREVPQYWHLAHDLSFITLGEASVSVASGVDAWPDGDDGEVLDVWRKAFASLCSWSAALDVELAGESVPLRGAGATVLPLFMARERGLPSAELSALVRQTAMLDAETAWSEAVWSSWVSRHGDPAEVLYDRLTLLGAVHRTDDVVRLTPLGLYALWHEVQSEVDIPLLPPPEDMTASDIVSIALLGTDDQLCQEWRAWLTTRTPTEAATELAAAAAEGSPAQRATAISLLHDLGPPELLSEQFDIPPPCLYAEQARIETLDDRADGRPTDDVTRRAADRLHDANVRAPPDASVKGLASPQLTPGNRPAQ